MMSPQKKPDTTAAYAQIEISILQSYFIITAYPLQPPMETRLEL